MSNLTTTAKAGKSYPKNTLVKLKFLSGKGVVLDDCPAKDSPHGRVINGPITETSAGSVELHGDLETMKISASVTEGDLLEWDGTALKKHSGGSSKSCGVALQSIAYKAGVTESCLVLVRFAL